MKLKTLAIPIRRVDFSNSSQILTFFTRERGWVSAIAKGAYRPRNAFQGPFDLMTLGEVVLFGRRGGTGLDIVTEASQVDGFRGLRGRWDRYVASAHVLDFLRAVETPEDPNVPLFDATAAALGELDRAGTTGEVASALATFELRGFRALGLAAEITACGECGRPWTRVEQPVFFSLEGFAVLCARCRQRRPACPGRIVPGAVVCELNRLGRPVGRDPRRGAPVVADATRPAADAAPPRELRELLSGLRVFLLERRFPMIEYTAGFF